jgi:hypothetical protein
MEETEQTEECMSQQLTDAAESTARLLLFLSDKHPAKDGESPIEENHQPKQGDDS